MHSNSPNPFSEKELDKLINRSFLELDFNEPTNEKIAGSLAAHALGISATENITKKSLIKRLIGTINLQVFLISSVLVTGGVLEFTFLSKNPEGAFNQTIESSSNNKDAPQKSAPLKSNPETSNKNMYQQSSMENNTSAQIINLAIQKNKSIHFKNLAILLPKEKGITLHKEQIKINTTTSTAYGQTIEVSDNKNGAEQKSNTEISYKGMHEVTSLDNTIYTQNDSATNNLVIQKPEPTYFDYPVILLSKERDTTSENLKTNENKNLKNDIPKKNRTKTNSGIHSAKHTKNKKVYRGRSNAKEKNKNKTERDRSGRIYNF